MILDAWRCFEEEEDKRERERERERERKRRKRRVSLGGDRVMAVVTVCGYIVVRPGLRRGS